jgi:hypothetical protein
MTTTGVNFFLMNSSKEPEPAPRRLSLKCGMGHEAGQILRMDRREGDGSVCWTEAKEFIGG